MSDTASATQFSRDHLRLLLISHKNQQWLAKLDLRLSLAGIIGAALLYTSVNIPAFLAYSQVPYLNFTRSNSNLLVAASFTNNPATSPTANPTTGTNNPNSPVSDQSSSNLNNNLFYRGINVSAPIAWDVDYAKDQVDTALESGLAHINGTARPGEQGTTIIVGHSSAFAWSKGSYKTVFAPLFKAGMGDNVVLFYQNKKYTYKVSAVYEVDPSRVDVLNTAPDVNLRLITCAPLGSSARRLVVEATQIDPKPEQNTPFESTPFVADQLIVTR